MWGANMCKHLSPLYIDVSSTEPATISLTSSPASPIMAGDTVTLTCSVTLPTGVTGTPAFQWEGPGVSSMPADSTTSGNMVSSDLTLSEIATSQAGQYTCIVTLSGSVNVSLNIHVQSKLDCTHNVYNIMYTSTSQSQSPLHPSLSVILTLCMLELHSV